MRLSLFLFPVVIVAALLVGWGGWQDRQQTAARRQEAWAERQRIEATDAALDRQVHISRAKFSFRGLLRHLGDQAGVTIEFDEERLLADWPLRGFTLDLPAGDFSLRSVLGHILHPLDMTYVVGDGRILVTTAEAAITRLRTAVYPLPQPGFAGSQTDSDTWAELVTLLVEPQSWDEVGGRGYIEPVPGALVVVQTDDIHRHLRELLAALGGLENPPADSRPVPLPPLRQTEAERRIADELAEPAQIVCEKLPLRKLVAALSRWHRIPIVLSSVKLEEAGVRANTPITRTLTGVTLRSALNAVLGELELTWTIRNETLLITTPEDAESRLEYVAYPVHDLVDSDGGQWDHVPLIELIYSTIAPQSWGEVGGPASDILDLDGWLIVQQTHEVHGLIELLLAQMRRALAHGDHPAVLDAADCSETTLRIRAALEEPISLRYVEYPLDKVCRELADRLRVPVWLNTRKLEEVGVDPETPMTCDLPAAPLRTQLQWLLGGIELTWVVRDESIQITSPEDCECHLQSRIYDVRPLTDADLGVADAESLQELVTEFIAPQAWNEVGGPGSAQEFRGLLIVNQSEAVHDEIARLFTALETHCLRRGPSTRHEPRIVRLDASPGDEALEAALQLPVGVSFDHEPLVAALSRVAEEHGLRLKFDHNVLDRAGINPDRPLTLSAEGETLGGLFERILRPHELGLMVRGGVLLVTSADVAEGITQIRLVRVDDLTSGKASTAEVLARQIVAEVMPWHWSETGGPGEVGAIAGRWLLVSAGWPMQLDVADWLAKQRTGWPTQRATEREALEDWRDYSLEELDEAPAGANGNPEAPEDPFGTPAPAPAPAPAADDPFGTPAPAPAPAPRDPFADPFAPGRK